ncbi:hypothetical protein D046_3197A, partial [Vibrio parahaemolyticus V-223/04]
MNKICKKSWKPCGLLHEKTGSCAIAQNEINSLMN